MYRIDDNRGLGSWFKKRWRRIASSVATILGGPLAGLIVAGALELIPRKDSGPVEFGAQIENQLDLWAQISFDAWFTRRLKVINKFTSIATLTNTTILNELNRTLLEMYSLAQYYAYKGSLPGGDSQLMLAKSKVIKDSILEFKKLLAAQVSEIGGTLPSSVVNTNTITPSDTPDSINWNGKNFKIQVSQYGNSVSNELPNQTIPHKPTPIIPQGDNEIEIFLDTNDDIVLPPISTSTSTPIRPTDQNTEVLNLTTASKPSTTAQDTGVKKKYTVKKAAGIGALLAGLWWISTRKSTPRKKQKSKSRKKKAKK